MTEAQDLDGGKTIYIKAKGNKTTKKNNTISYFLVTTVRAKASWLKGIRKPGFINTDFHWVL